VNTVHSLTKQPTIKPPFVRLKYILRHLSGVAHYVTLVMVQLFCCTTKYGMVFQLPADKYSGIKPLSLKTRFCSRALSTKPGYQRLKATVSTTPLTWRCLGF